MIYQKKDFKEELLIISEIDDEEINMTIEKRKVDKNKKDINNRTT